MSKLKSSKKHYVDTDLLESYWADWLKTGSDESWAKLSSDVYKICQGVAVNFNPKDEEEHLELCHETYVLTLEKIRSKKLIFEPGRAPVFNLLTTTIFRHLFSLKNKTKRRRNLLKEKYIHKSPVAGRVFGVSDLGGYSKPHPESRKIISAVLDQIQRDSH